MRSRNLLEIFWGWICRHPG